MQFKNFEVRLLGELLYSLSLKVRDSRMRTRFVNILDAHIVQVIDKEILDLLNHYGKRDSNGELISTGDNVFALIEETSSEYHKETFALMNEDFYIEESESNKDMLLTVAKVMVEGDFEVSGDMAKMYDGWYVKFEEFMKNNSHKE